MPKSPVYREPHNRPCVHCGKLLSDMLRRDAAYCSNSCRQAAYRGRGTMLTGRVIAGLDTTDGPRHMRMRVAFARGYGGLALADLALSSVEEVGEAMDRYGVNMLAVSSMPERRLARGLEREHPGRVVLVQLPLGDGDDMALLMRTARETGGR